MNRGPAHKPLVAVVGGGISGLSVAFWLLQKGMETIVLEQTHRPGGIIRSEGADGFLVDYAANCLLNYLPEVNTLCDVVGTRDEQIYRSEAARNRYLLKNGRPVQFPRGPLGFVRTNLWSIKGKLRLLSEPFIPRAKSGGEETVSQFITRRFGRETLDYIVEPFVGGSYAGNPSQMSLKSTFPVLSALEQRYGSLIIGAVLKRLRGSRASCPMHLFSFRSGMEALPKAIGRYLGARLLTRCMVKEIVPGGDKRWDIFAEQDGTSMVYHADAAIIATRSMEAAELIHPIDPVSSERLKRVEYSPLAVVYTGFRGDAVGHPLDGIGCMIPSKEGRNLLGTLWNSTLFPDRAPEGMVALTNYLGGRRHPEMVDKTDEELLYAAMADMKGTLGIKNPPAFVRIARYKGALPQYSIGHQDMLRTVEGLPDRVPGLFITGNYLRGISVRDCISYGAKLAGKISERLL
jgi:oxygen-dependent protoporphyrinogen oxidase